MNFIERLFVGYSFDQIGPHFIFDDINTKSREKMYFDNVTLSIKKLDRRLCIGTYDLNTFTTEPCSDQNRLDTQVKENHCDRCQYKIGFNPAFYNTSSISPQQEKYNATPHVVYMAYFSSSYIKVGIASEKRCSIRLLEQGARAAVILDKFPNAYMARQLESELCSKPDIIEVLSSDAKLKLLVNENYDFKKAKEVLKNMIEMYYNKASTNQIKDLSPYYFYGKIYPEISEMHKVIGSMGSIISGKLIGMIGDQVIISQSTSNNDVFLPVSVKKFISHMVNIYLGQIIEKYSYEPKQLFFWN